MLGLGGIFTEVIKDTTFRLAPLSVADAHAMMTSLRASPLLDDFRGMKRIDRDALSRVLIRLGHLALDFPEIREIDLNPIVIRDGQPVIVDALFVL